MKIQHISLDGKSNRFKELVHVENQFNRAEVLDDYDLNIIDFTNAGIWCTKGNSPGYSVEHSNIQSLSALLYQSSSSKTMILLPGNIKYRYAFDHYSGYYNDSVDLKDTLPTVQKYILLTLYALQYELTFGRTVTNLCGTEAHSDFYFSSNSLFAIETITDAGKATTIRYKNIYITTINIENSDILKKYLITIGMECEARENPPDWFAGFKAFDDLDLEVRIEKSKAVIMREEETIQFAEKQLEKNKQWKSILYSTGDELEDTVRKIFDELFNSNICEFVDEKKEDFRFDYCGKTVIGEICILRSQSDIDAFRGGHIAKQNGHPETLNTQLINPLAG